MVNQNTFRFKCDRVVVLVYAVLFVVVSLFVFYANGESQPVADIFQWGNLIPAVIYSGFSLWFSFGLFLLLNKIVNRIIALPVALLIGIPGGLVILDKILRLIF